MRAPRKSLQAGRPPTAKVERLSMSRKASRALINKHHQLEKKLRQATLQRDGETQSAVADEIIKLGGLDRYQQASLQGQRNDRGGDTSKILLKWLSLENIGKMSRRPRMLEIGSLSTCNACSTSDRFEMVHIDLLSQGAGILKQDFMQRPIPTHSSEEFDLISLSLVLNFVPDAESRGRMLLRTLSFLRCDETVGKESLFPSLFIVLPRSCLDNSRYLTDNTFKSLMESLGFSLERFEKTQKLAYSLWTRKLIVDISNVSFLKKEVNPGRTRNNFCITLIGPPA